MAYKLKSKKVKEEKNSSKKHYPVYYLEDPEGNGLTEQETIDLWQENVDNGMVWRLQGWYGRNAQALLDEGIIHYPEKHSGQSLTDYYGNPIPTHKEAKEKGIYERGKRKREIEKHFEGL